MELNKKKPQALIDVILFFAISSLIYIIYGLNAKSIVAFITDSSIDIVIRTLAVCFSHFCQAGAAFVILMIIRREKFSEFGLSKHNLLPCIARSSLVLLVYESILFIRGYWRLFYPFKVLSVSEELISTSPFFITIIGAVLFTIVCGFFESFNYIYIVKKLDQLFPVKNVFLRPGPIIVSILGYAGHAMMGITGWEGTLPFLFLLYGALVIYEKTENAWGCVGIFFLIWFTL